MPVHFPPPTLKLACLSSISTNMQNYFCKLDVAIENGTPFDFIPGILKEELVEYLQKHKVLNECWFQLILSGPNLVRNLKLSKWDRYAVNGLPASQLSSLTQLDLSDASGSIFEPSEIWELGRDLNNIFNEYDKTFLSTLNELPTKIPNITSLNVSFIDCCDDGFLRALSLHCPKLRKLYARSCKSITNEGIVEFVSGSKVPALNTLDIRHTRISVATAYKIMISLPYLEHFDYHKLYMVFTTEQMQLSIAKGNTFNIIKLSDFEDGIFPQSVQCPVDLGIVVQGCPKLAHLERRHMSNEDLNIVSSLTTLKTLRFISFEHESAMIDFLSKRGEQLEALKMGGQLETMKLLARFCPNLRSLSLPRSKLNRRFEPVNWPPLPFNRLIELSINSFKDDIPAKDLLAMLSNCRNIEKLELKDVRITDKIISDILKINPLDKLIEIRLNFCTGLTMSGVRDIVSHAANLKILQCNECHISNAEFDQLKKEMLGQNFDIKILYFNMPLLG